MKDKCLFQILLDNDFTHVVTKLSNKDKFLNLFRKNKKQPKTHMDWVEKNIYGKKYELFLYDMHMIYVRIDGEIVLAEDDRKISDEEILNKISILNK